MSTTCRISFYMLYFSWYPTGNQAGLLYTTVVPLVGHILVFQDARPLALLPL